MSFEASQLYTNRVELFGVITGLISVGLLLLPARPRLQWFTWVAGILTSGAYVVVFKQSSLYLNSALQIYFVVISVIGAYTWIGQLLGRGITVKELPTTYGPKRSVLVIYVVGLLISFPLSGIFRLTDDTSPFLDALIVTISGGAVWLQTKKYIESWYGWIAVDLIAIPLFASQRLGATALLYVAYLMMCFIGLKTWRADSRRVLPGTDSASGIGALAALPD